ncbi:MAG: orotidine-5'-phosphate decarboxylase [Firmicutes bacterium]|nr:orotidine-5'-phosphate decarboxylase [Bacillota bacterium]
MIFLRKKIIVALDIAEESSVKELVNSLENRVEVFKIGLEQYLTSRGKVVDYLNSKGKKVFLDLKFHDIPNTMAAAARQAVGHGVWMFNIHVTGLEGMKAVVEAAGDEALKLGVKKPLIIGVTVLTSLNNNDLQMLGNLYSAGELVLKKAALAAEAGLDGVVCSANEAGKIKEEANGFLTVCPGIRPDWAVKGDQKRIMTPANAVKEGADYLVIGRPITKADNPAAAVEKIIDEIEGV